jgi:hypothetical protein
MTSRILLMAALALAACSKSSESESKSSKVTEPATATPKAARPEPKPATAADFGKVPAPFGMLAKLKIGMTEAEAKAAAPQFWDKKGESRLVDTDWQDLHYSISFVDGRLNHFGLSNLGKTDLRGLLKQAWGPGIEAKNDIDYPYTVWFDAQTRWRAIVEARDGGGLELTQYLPIEALLGPDPVELAVFPKPMLGASPAELQASYPDLFQHKTKEQLDAASRTAEAQAKQLGTDVKLGSASTDLTTMKLPPLEWSSMYTDVLLLFDEAKTKLRIYKITINDKGAPGAADTTLALMKKKWGEPKVKKTYKEKLIFRPKQPAIVVERDATDRGWEITYGAKLDDAL